MDRFARPLQPHEIERLTLGCSPRDRALLWCMLGAGLRAAEAAALQVGNVGPDGSVHVEHGKGDRERDVWLTGRAQEAVSIHKVTLEDQSPEAPLFPSRKRKNGRLTPMLATSAVNLVKQIMREAGISNASSHSLRRTHAQGLEASGASVRIIQRQLGHKNVHTTELYLAKNPPGYREAVRALEFRT